MKIVALICLCLWVGASDSSRILGIFPHFGRSHWDTFKPIVEELVSRGHHLTVVSPFPRKTPLKNYVDVSIESSFPKTEEYVDFADMESVSRYSVLEMYPLYFMAEMTETTFEREEVLALANEKFDLIITELFNTEIYQALAYKIKAPVITICTHQITGYGTLVSSTPDVPSYVPHHLGFRSPPFSFIDRLMNLVELIFVKLVYLYAFIPRSQAKAEKFLGPLPDLVELSENTSLVLLNVHFSVSNPRPLNPNVIEIGGINVLPPKPLPSDVQKIMDESKNGVIYFSMGTVLKASTLSEQKRTAFTKAFAALKQTVLWKWDGPLEGKPDNVHIKSWWPQRDLLAHKNIVLFISHCGNLGLNEAVHEGTPIICIPMFGDQPYNSKSVESQGMAEILDFYSDLTENKIRTTINKMLLTQSYGENARKVSRAYRDRPMTPLQTAIYWIEYVIRNEGAYYLRPKARHMSWWAYHNYDVFLVLLLLVLFIITLPLYVVYSCCKTKKKTTKQPQVRKTKVKKS